ncbi:MAG TPA: hypothetical protein ENK90_02165, partial [Epsilonproteobacteria bacterium]|nr:hypothetical protein [Campylobacterota bacterium]
VNGLVVGASMYYGGGSNLKDSPEVDGLTTTMFDIHGRYESGAFSAYGLYTQTSLDGAEKLGSNAAKKASGYYGNIAYDIGGLIGLDYKIPVFAQYENYNPVEKTVDGQNEDTFDTETVTIGFNFFPTDQTVLKFDYEMNDVNGQETNTVSVGLGFIF